MTDPTEPTFNNIPASAPLFRGASAEELQSIVEFLSYASYHFADDSAKEWGTGTRRLMEAAERANARRLGYAALLALHSHKPQLVSFEQFIDACFADLRKRVQP